MDKMRDEDVELLTISEAARLVKTSRDTIRAAMNAWERSGHRFGLRWLQPANRRMIRRVSLREWEESLERGVVTYV